MEKSDLEKLLETEQRSKSNTHRIDGLETKINDLSDVYIVLTKVSGKVENVEKDVSEIKSDIKDKKNVKTQNPIRWYETKAFETSIKFFWIVIILMLVIIAGKDFLAIFEVIPK